MNRKLYLSLIAFCLAPFAAIQIAHAVLPPDIQGEIDRKHKHDIDQAKTLATEVVFIRAIDVTQHGQRYVATAKVQDVIRSKNGVRPDDIITIEYVDISAADRRYNAKVKRAKIPGPGFKPALYLLKKGDIVRAWLIPAPGKTGTFTLGAGIGSFETIEKQ